MATTVSAIFNKTRDIACLQLTPGFEVALHVGDVGVVTAVKRLRDREETFDHRVQEQVKAASADLVAKAQEQARQTVSLELEDLRRQATAGTLCQRIRRDNEQTTASSIIDGVRNGEFASDR